MKVGDLVMIKQGLRYGKVGIILRGANSGPQGPLGGPVIVSLCDGYSHGYYKRDLEVINESR